MSTPASPSMAGRLRELAPAVVCIVSLVALYRTWLLGGALLVGVLVALAYLRAYTPTFIWQFIYALGGGATAYMLARILDGRLPVELCALFLGTAIGRLPLAAPALRGRLDFLLFAFAMVALGGSREPGKVAYAACSVALALSLAFSSVDVSPLRAIKDHPWAALLVVVLGGALAAALGFITPRMTGGRFLSIPDIQSKTGFSGRVRLGGQSGMETSDLIVMRIRGGHPDYLRGAVMDSFSAERDVWSTTRAKVSFPESVKGSISVSSVKPTKNLFAPLGASGLTEGVARDAYGIATVPVGISEYTIDPNGGTASDAPDPKDTEVPVAIRARLVSLAEQIVGDEKDDRKRVRLLESYLARNYHYSLSRTKAQRERSALMDFLLVNREGHCEYFASSLALLARALGIPARIVAGYRVVEQNQYGHYDVVRERNAHAWVELWDRQDGRWRTADPTPTTEAMAPRTSDDAGALLDAAREKIAELGQTLAERPLVLLGTLGALSAFLLSRRFLARPFRKKRERVVEVHRLFAEISSALANVGLERPSWEGIEAFAARVRDAELPSAADVLIHYAKVRYDPNESSATALEKELAEELRALKANVSAVRARRTEART